MLLKERIETIAHNVTLSRVTLGLVYFRSTVAGTIKTITIYRSTGGGIGGSWYFNVRKNGSAQFSGAGRPTFSLGVESVSKTGLSIAVAVGDVFELDLEQTGSGTILGHLVMSMEIETADDVFTATITSPAQGQSIVYNGTNWVNTGTRTQTDASSATPTPASDTCDIYTLTALAAAAVFAAPTGTPVNGQALMIRIKDNGTARTLGWNSVYRAVGVTLPTTTVISKTLYVGCVYNSADSKWDVVGVCQEA